MVERALRSVTAMCLIHLYNVTLAFIVIDKYKEKLTPIGEIHICYRYYTIYLTINPFSFYFYINFLYFSISYYIL